MTTNRYWVAGAAFCAFTLLAWATAGPLLHLQGRQFWVLLAGLTALGGIGSGAWLWFVSNKAAESASGGSEAADSARDTEDVALLIKEAEAMLGRSSKAPSSSIANLPLFLVLGETGSAKTSTIVNSGLELDLLAGQVGDPNVAPTRCANVWLAKNLIFVEAGGSVLENPAQWRTLIRKLHPSRLRSVLGRKNMAPRAAIVCVDYQRLLQSGARAAMESLARKLRERLGSVSQVLGIHFPVYVVFTRMDQASFFSQFVRNFSNEEASQVVGASLPTAPFVHTYADEQTHRVQSALDEIFYSLAALRPEYLRRSQEEAGDLPGIYEFPREFRKVAPLVIQFLVELCRPSQLQESPFLRGFYFSGARAVVETDVAVASVKRPTRAAKPDDLGATVMFNIAEGAPGPLSGSHDFGGHGGRRVPQWVFLRNLFTEVLPRDRMGMYASLSSSKTAFTQRLLLGSAMAACLIWTVLLVVSYIGNRALQSEVSAAASNLPVRAAGVDLMPAAEQLDRMDRLRSALGKLSEYIQESPWSLHWGLYSAQHLYVPARRIYFHQLLHPLLFQATQAALLNRLAQLPAKPGPDDPFKPNYDTLKAYLMTTSHHEKSTKEWLSPFLLRTWLQNHPAGKDSEALIARQFDFYSDELRRENPFNSAEDSGNVEHARAYLHAFNQLDRLYRMNIEQAGAGRSAINFSRLYPQPSVGDRHIVEAAFTKPGWIAMQDAIRKGGNTGEDWVMGKGGDANIDVAQFRQQLRDKYLKDYIEEWRAFVRGGYIVPYAGLPDAAKKLSLTAAGNQSPLLALLALVSENTSVDPEVAKQFEAAAAVVAPGKKGEYLGPSNKPYMDSLLALQLAVEQWVGNPNAGSQSDLSALAAKSAALQLASAFPDDREAKLNDVVKKLLLDPITGLPKPADPRVAAGAGVCRECQTLWTKYPFNPKATTDATVDEMNHFFQPETGTLWAFYNGQLKQALVLNGSNYVAQSDGSFTLSKAFVDFFNRAAAFSRAAYSGGAAPHLSFTMSKRSLESINEVKIATSDSQLMVVTPTSGVPQPFKWPTQLVKFEADSITGDWSGPWSMFKFFTTAENDRWVKSGTGYVVEWALIKRLGGMQNGQKGILRMNVDMNGAPPIFEKSYFLDMHCPKSVTQ